jgi:hypothetical protein
MPAADGRFKARSRLYESAAGTISARTDFRVSRMKFTRNATETNALQRS